MPEEKVSAQTTYGVTCTCDRFGPCLVHSFPTPPAADAGPRHACTRCGSDMETATRVRDGASILVCSRWPNCTHIREFTAPPVPQEAAASGIVATFMDMPIRLDETMPVGQVDIEDSRGRRTTIVPAPDEAMRPKRNVQLQEHAIQLAAIGMAGLNQPLWETRNKIILYLEDVVFPEHAALIRQTESERERKLREAAKKLRVFAHKLEGSADGHYWRCRECYAQGSTFAKIGHDQDCEVGEAARLLGGES